MKQKSEIKKENTSLNMNSISKKFIPRKKDSEGNTVEPGFFEVSENELKALENLNKSLKGK